MKQIYLLMCLYECHTEGVENSDRIEHDHIAAYSSKKRAVEGAKAHFDELYSGIEEPDWDHLLGNNHVMVAGEDMYVIDCFEIDPEGYVE